jgi:hypothetical protein
MQVGEYDIPEGWDSMTCIYNCGFILIWQMGSPEADNVGTLMRLHLGIHDSPKPSIRDWFKFGREQ